LDLLRNVIEVATFRVRGGEERRNTARGLKSRSSESRAGDSRAGDSRNEGSQSQDSGGQDAQAQEFRNQERRNAERRARSRRPPSPRKRPRPVAAETANQQISVTVSVGAAEPSGRHRSVEQVIQAADQALYRAKQSGRNRVELSSPPRTSRLKRNIA
jgi:GGDEF domain-containing protein